MDRLIGRVAVVTGASAGVGAAISVKLVQHGVTVVAVARRLEKIQDLQSKVSGASGRLVPLQGDVSKEDDIKRIFEFVKKTYNTIHLLVNNAGFMITGKFIDGEPEDWKRVLDVNVIGLAACSKKAIQLMRESGVDDGHVININSVAGHRIPPTDNPIFNIYPPSKYAVTAISETLRMELQSIGSKIRVTNLSPGYIKTEFVQAAVQNDPETLKTFEKYLADKPGLAGDDLADAVIYIISAPKHVQIHELTMTAV